jgi:DNA-binding CsgD family transcriptional regulator
MAEAIGSGVHSAGLTPTERRILELRAAGLNRNDIAQLMHRSPQTISNSLTIAKEKLGARSLVEAAALVSQRRRRPGAFLSESLAGPSDERNSRLAPKSFEPADRDSCDRAEALLPPSRPDVKVMRTLSLSPGHARILGGRLTGR